MGLSLSAVEALIFRSRRVLASRLEGEAAPKRRRSLAGFVDLGSLVGAVKSLFGGASAVKVTAGVIAVAGATAIAGTALPVRAEPQVSKAPATAVTASTANGSDAVLRSGPQGRAQHGLEAGRNAGKPGGAGSARSGATRPAGKPAAPTGPGSAPAGGVVPEAPTLPADPPAAPVIPGSLPDPADVALLLPQAPQLPQVPAQALPPISLPAPLSALPTLSSVPDSGVTLP
jgi:hypothetical protein